jgi:hypothetical protein
MAGDDGFQLKVGGKSIEWPEGKELLARGSEVSWSPQSSAFFINYANGSGLDGGTLKVYSLSNGQIVSHNGINQQIVQRFRADVGCSNQASDPNVRGLGWSDNGAEIYAFAQTTVSQPCGRPGNFRGMVINIAEDSVRRFYSEATTKLHFHDLLPYNMR